MRFVKHLTGREGFQPVIEHPGPPLILFADAVFYSSYRHLSVYCRTHRSVLKYVSYYRIVGLAQLLRHIHISVNGSIEFNIHDQEL